MKLLISIDLSIDAMISLQNVPPNMSFVMCTPPYLPTAAANGPVVRGGQWILAAGFYLFPRCCDTARYDLISSSMLSDYAMYVQPLSNIVQ